MKDADENGSEEDNYYEEEYEYDQDEVPIKCEDGMLLKDGKCMLKPYSKYNNLGCWKDVPTRVFKKMLVLYIV